MNDQISQDAVQSTDSQPQLNTADRNPDAARIELIRATENDIVKKLAEAGETTESPKVEG